MMTLRTLPIIAVIFILSVAPVGAKTKTPKSTNANVHQATRKAKKYKPAKYKAPKLSKKPSKSARVKYGSKQKN